MAIGALSPTESRKVSEGSPRANEVKAGAVLSYAVIAVQFVVAMSYTPVMLRLLGQAEYGLYILVVSIVGYLSLISFGLAGAYMRFYARFRVLEDWDGVGRLNGMFLLVFSAISVIVVIAGSVLTLNVGALLGDQFSNDELDTATVLFAVLVMNSAITLPASVFNSYIIAHERFIFQKTLQIMASLVSPAITIPALLLGYGSVGMAICLTAANVVFTVWTVVYCRSTLRMRFAFRGLDFSLLREIFVFSGFLFVNLVVDQINWNVDKFIIGRIQGPAPVAVYGVAAMINANYMFFSTAISSVLVSRVNRMVASAQSDRQLSDLFTRVGRVQFLVLGLVVTGFVFFGRPFIELWAGPDYGDAYAIAILLMVPVTIPLIQNLGIEIQKAKNLHQFRSWVYFGVAVGNIMISVPLTRQFGGTGAAAATAVALVIGNVLVMNWHYQARVGLDIKDFWRQILRVSIGMLPALIAGAAISRTSYGNSISALIVLGAVYAAIYVVGVWWLGMNNYERCLFGSPIRRAATRWSRT